MKVLIAGSTLQRLGPSYRSLWENLAAFLDIRVYDLLAADALCSGNFNGGAAAFALGAPALVLLLREDATLRRIAIGVAVSMLTVFMLVELDLFYARFVLFAALLPSLALARLWERHRFIVVLAGAALALQFLATVVPGNLQPERLSSMLRQGWTERSSIPAPRATGLDEPVGYCSDNFGDAYPLYGPGFSRRVVYLRETTWEALLDRLKKEGVRVFFVEGAMRQRSRMIEEALGRHDLTAVTEGPWKGYALTDRR